MSKFVHYATLTLIDKDWQVYVLSRITFDDVMDFYPKHNRAIFNEIVRAQKNNVLIPFIGAGMSVFCGYKTWEKLLPELAEYIPEKTRKRYCFAAD